MTNAEKYIGDEDTIDEFISDLVEFLPKRLHRHYDGEKAPLYGALVDFFKSEVRPTLTEDEEVILRNIRENYKTIGRDDVGELYISEYYDDDTRDVVELTEFKDNIFQFIKEGEKYSIEELLGDEK